MQRGPRECARDQAAERRAVGAARAAPSVAPAQDVRAEKPADVVGAGFGSRHTPKGGSGERPTLNLGH